MDTNSIENLNFESLSLPNVGYALLDTPSIVTQEIQQEIDLIMTRQKTPKPWNKELAGQIRGEFAIDFSADARAKLAEAGHRFMGNYGEPITKELNLLSAWINMQVKYEYNPIHNHDGALSWVTWVNIPYELEDELKLFPNANCQDVSMFSFVYTSALGEIATYRLPIDKTWEGTMCIFPARMRHAVAPFYTSNGVRISVAGNLG
jgi:hypothetical protein